MKTERTQAVVLRRTNYGEADRILQLLTPDGRRSAMARGVRKEKSKLAGGIELFAVSDVVLGRGKGDLHVLTSARLVQFYRGILNDYDAMQFAYEVLKLVARASEMIDEPDWFSITREVLAGLDNSQVSKELVEAWFFVRYAALLGHEFGLQYDIDGHKLSANQTYRYDVSEQGLRADERGGITASHIKFLRLIATKPIATLQQVGGVESIVTTCALLARQHAAV